MGYEVIFFNSFEMQKTLKTYKFITLKRYYISMVVKYIIYKKYAILLL